MKPKQPVYSFGQISDKSLNLSRGNIKLKHENFAVVLDFHILAGPISFSFSAKSNAIGNNVFCNISRCQKFSKSYYHYKAYFISSHRVVSLKKLVKPIRNE